MIDFLLTAKKKSNLKYF